MIKKNHTFYILLILAISIPLLSYDRVPAQQDSSEQTWLVMLYVDADDELLEAALTANLNEAELIGSSDQVHIVAQVDRFAGGFDGDGDWTNTKRFYLTQDNDFGKFNSDEVMDIGEANMADGATLVDFVSWAVATYPAEKYVLLLNDHGTGWPGGWTDASAPDDLLTLDELDDALAQIQADTTLSQFDLIGFDACLMSTLEVYTMLTPYARYAVASEDVTRSIGWAYAAFLESLVNNPGMNGGELAQSIVDNYLDQDVLAPYVPQDILEQYKREMTITAVDLAQVPDLLTALDVWVASAAEVDQVSVATARFYAKSYTSIFGRTVPGSFLDLGHLAAVLAAEVDSGSFSQTTTHLLATIDQAVIAERHGSAQPGSTGITIYFPNSFLYAHQELPGSKAYTATASRFADETLWDDFLLAHYTIADMPQPGAGNIAFADEDENIIGPGVGNIEFTPISSSSDTVAIGDSVFLEVEVMGGPIAHFYFFGAFLDEQSDSTLMLASYFLGAAENKEVDGVWYPDWAAETEGGVLSMGSNLSPEILGITNGTDFAQTLWVPEGYGGGTYVYGTHVSAATGEQRPARMYFGRETETMLSLLVFTDIAGTLVPREVEPVPGDQFIVETIWIDNNTGKYFYVQGDSLAFGDEPLWLDTAPAWPGDYVYGVRIVDLDGNVYLESTVLTVTD